MARFDPIAKKYDSWWEVDPFYHPLHQAFITALQEHFVEYSQKALARGRAASSVVFEIGYGTGYTTEEILRSSPDTFVFGADPSRQMRRGAIKRLTEAGLLERTDLISAEAQEGLAMYPAWFDAVVSVCTLHNIEPEERLDVCRLSFKALRAGGAFISGDKIAPDSRVSYLKLIDQQLRFIQGYRDRGDLEAYTYWTVHEAEDHLNRITERQTVAMLKKAGFVRTKILGRFGIYALVIGYKPD